MISSLPSRYTVNEAKPGATIFTHPISYQNCSCAKSYLCSSSATVNTSNVTMINYIRGFRVGCFPLEALLQSTLDCLYDQACLDLLIRSLQKRLTFNVTALDSRQPSRFRTNTTVETIVGQLLVEEWFTNISYDAFFAACQPKSCTYTYTTRINLMYAATTFVGIYGGLIVGLRLLVPFVVKAGIHIHKCRHNRLTPSMNVPNDNFNRRTVRSIMIVEHLG